MRERVIVIEEESEAGLLNLTPLLDVLFVVLIMFIIIAPIIDLEWDRVSLAPYHTDASDNIAEQMRPIKIYVHNDNSLWLGRHHISLQTLEATLKELHRVYPNEVPELYQDQTAAFGTYQRVKNAVEAAGFAELDVVLKNE